MPQLQYCGTVSQTLLSNSGLGRTHQYQLNFFDQPITWSSNVPTQLAGATLNQLQGGNSPVYGLTTIAYNGIVSLTGQQGYNFGGTPQITVQICLSTDTSNQCSISKTYEAIKSGGTLGSGTATYNVHDTIPLVTAQNDPDYPLSVIISTACPSPCVFDSARAVTFIFTLEVCLSINCSGNNLSQSFCQDYCNDPANYQSCLADYTDYCFPNIIGTPSTPGNPNPCQNFFSNYIESQGPRAEIDTGLASYCQQKYKGFGDLMSSGNTSDINLCGCHMQQSQYDAYQQQLFNLFPGFSALGLNEYCLFAPCANSAYRNVNIGAKCNLPQCISIASFTNQGTFDQGSVTITQTTGQCANITRNSGGGGGGNGPSPSDHHYGWIIIVVVVGILVLLVIVVAFIIIRKKHHEAVSTTVRGEIPSSMST